MKTGLPRTMSSVICKIIWRTEGRERELKKRNKIERGRPEKMRGY